MTIEVAIVDSRRLFRESLAALVNDAQGFSVASVCESVAELAADAAAADVVLLGQARDPAKPAAHRPQVRLAAHATWHDVLAALARAVTDSAASTARQLRPTLRPTLTPRSALTPGELAVLTLVSRGLSAAEIAVERGISARTVAAYVRTALVKLGVRSQSQAVARCLELGLLGPSGSTTHEQSPPRAQRIG